jgi:glycine oxidase
MKRDYIIVGQGLAGTALAWELTRRGRSVLVYDEPAQNRASAVAAGLFNPITGRVMTKTWKAEVIFPFLQKFYGEAEKQLLQKFIFPVPVYRPFLSADERSLWKTRSESSLLKEFLLAFHDKESFAHQVHNPFGGIEIAQSGYLLVNVWMAAVRDFLNAIESVRDEPFLEEVLVAEDSIQYKDCMASGIIFCNGLNAMSSRWFGWIPLKTLKGQTIEVTLNEAPERIYNHGVFLVPSGGAKTYRAGATYEHAPFAEGITSDGRLELDGKLRTLIRLRYEIIHQEWGIRPTTPDRRPLLGAHPANKNVVIFNGLGTKGVSLAPYFACHLADWLEGKGDLSDEVNINRFKALYSK